jgi:3-oxoacyl-[acyl-carrier protein] reductase
MELGLDGTSAIVGGASAGMGRAISAALAAEGCSVTMLARDAGRLEDTARGIAASAGRAEPRAVAGDVRDEETLRRAVDATVAATGRLDIVVNNAGGPPPGTFESVPAEAWADAFELSLHSAVRLTRLALPHMRASGRGRIVNITSSSVREPIENLMLSNAIRPGVVGWAKALAREVGADGITVNTIAPGKIDTDRLRKTWASRQDPDAARRTDMAAIPLGRVGRPEEVAAAVAFLCSVPGGYVNGIVLPVDGGLLRGIW